MREREREIAMVNSPLGVEVEVVGDRQLELTFSPQQIDTTTPSSMSNSIYRAIDKITTFIFKEKATDM